MFQAPLAVFDDRPGCLFGCLAENLEDDHGLGLQVVEDAPVLVFVADPQLVAPRSDVRHGPGMRQADSFALLQPPEQHAGLNPGLG